MNCVERYRPVDARSAAFVPDAYSLVKPLLFALRPETAHEFALQTLALGVVPAYVAPADPVLALELFGRRLPHPLGLAAGFDKNGRVFGRMPQLGFAFVEIGGITPLPQAGNDRPRLFRLPADGALINRMGFPNAGAELVERRLAARRPADVVGINLASNTASRDPVGDFAGLVARFAPYGDYLTLDISCPNTVDGQLFLDPLPLRELLAAAAASVPKTRATALVVKLSPDITLARLDALVAVLLEARIDGIIVSNTTTARPALRGRNRAERGGLSGRPLFDASTAVLAHVARLTGGTIPLIGVGGIFSGADAYAKIRAGAHAVQLYTAFVYGGPALVTRIVRDLAALVRRDGFSSLAQATAAVAA